MGNQSRFINRIPVYQRDRTLPIYIQLPSPRAQIYFVALHEVHPQNGSKKSLEVKALASAQYIEWVSEAVLPDVYGEIVASGYFQLISQNSNQSSLQKMGYFSSLPFGLRPLSRNPFKSVVHQQTDSGSTIRWTPPFPSISNLTAGSWVRCIVLVSTVIIWMDPPVHSYGSVAPCKSQMRLNRQAPPLLGWASQFPCSEFDK